MNRRRAFLSAAIAVAAAAGCYTGPSSDLSPAVLGPGTASDGTDPAASEGGSSQAAPEAVGIPCDVAKVLATSCTDCHGARLTGGAPNALITYEDLASPSKSDPKKSVAEVSLERLKATKRPMPPDGALTPNEIAVFAKWVGAGLPRGACGSKVPSTPDGGTVVPTDAAPDASSVCSSGVKWPTNGAGSPLMHPGKTCIDCHSAKGGPSYAFAGTVYPTMHEPDECNGATKPGLSVLLIDATGKTHTMAVNAAGNFFRVTSMPMPYRALVVDGSKVREMKTPQTDGDCNGCHSEWGTQSPGRVMAP